ncbi:MAG: hypothetical protein IJQ75_00055 [Synergistaceae bacterium]|nr:hypothetical protein [Synergistaceae bacterium]
MSNIVKNERIKQTMKTTRKRHQNMTCRVFELKLNARKMSKPQKEQLTTYFREAKWRRNSIVANFEKAKRNAKSAFVKVGEIFEERPFTVLGSQVIQDIYDNVKTELKVLHTKKEKGEKVGRLKFKSFCNCIPLRQYNTTYRIDFLHKLVRIQNKGVKLASKRLNQAYKRNGQKKANNHYRRIKKLRRAYERDRNRRTDNANKVVHEILANNEFVAIQDEMIHNWHAGLFGKQVQHSAGMLCKYSPMKQEA